MANVTAIANSLAPVSHLAVAHIGAEFFPDKKALARAMKVYPDPPNPPPTHPTSSGAQ